MTHRKRCFRPGGLILMGFLCISCANQAFKASPVGNPALHHQTSSGVMLARYRCWIIWSWCGLFLWMRANTYDRIC